MAIIKISDLPAAATPLDGTEVLPIVKSGVTDQVSVANLTAGRAVSASGVTVTGLTASQAVLTDASKALVSVATTGSDNVVLSTSPSLSGPTINAGNLTFSSTAQKIAADFSNGTHSNRLLFQSSTVNGNTLVGATPNGTATTGGFSVYNNSDPTNASTGQLAALSTDIRLTAGAIGTGTQLPMKFYVNGLERVQIATNGYVAIGTAGVAPSAQLELGAGNLLFSSTAQRITGDFSNATVANRLAFQTSTVNSSTSVTALPSGTNTQADFFAFNNSDPTNASLVLLRATASETTLRSALTGTGTYLPMTFHTGGSERVRIDTSGNVGIGTAGVAPGALFDVGSGGLRVASTGSMTSGNLADAVGYKGTPLNEQSAAYTLVIGDMGKSIVHPASDNNARTFTIPANGTVAFPVGTTITFINMINTVTISITTDTMYLAGAGTTGSRTLAAYGMATAVKVTSTTWIISGNGLT